MSVPEPLVPLLPMSVKEKVLVDELMNSFRKIAVIDISNLSGAALAWAKNMNRLRELVLSADPRRFLQWDVILNSMFVYNSSYISKEMSSLKRSKKFNSFWKKGMIEGSEGSPISSKKYSGTSENLIHHTYHVQQFEEKTGLTPDMVDFVFEFGGGYGSMCRLFRNLGFNKQYVIFDLPVFSLLQKYFLQSSGHKILTVDEFLCKKEGALCISDFDVLRKVLECVVPKQKNLFIGTWSISETPMDFRSTIIDLLDSFNMFLIAYQDAFEDVNNSDYFAELQKTFARIQWNNWKIGHIPGSNYLIGKSFV